MQSTENLDFCKSQTIISGIMKKTISILLVFLCFTPECQSMAPSDIVSPVDRYKKKIKEVTQDILGQENNQNISTIILEYSCILISIYHEIPTRCPQLPPKTAITYELTPNFCIIDLKCFFAKMLQRSPQTFRLKLAKEEPIKGPFETNPLALISDRAPWPKTIIILNEKPIQPIKHRSCPCCLHKISYGNQLIIMPNRFEHKKDCPDRLKKIKRRNPLCSIAE